MPALEQVWGDRNRRIVQVLSVVAIAFIALIDWWTKPYVSLGFLYLFPILAVAAFLPRWAVVTLGAGCAMLTELFSSLEPSATRLSLEALALAGCGLFVSQLARNCRFTVEAEARLKTLVETSPAAIVTVDSNGFVEMANQSAAELLEPRAGLIGAPIAAFLPELHHALRWEDAPRFRSSMRCNGRKGSDARFTADVWLSAYNHGHSRKLAAIVVNVVEEESFVLARGDQMPAMNARETQVLRLLMEGLANKEIAARMEISEGTVKNTLQQLFARTKVRTRAQLVCIAFEHFREDSMPANVRTPVRGSTSSEARRMLSAHRYIA